MSTLGKSLVVIVIAAVLLAACASQPAATPVPVTPQGSILMQLNPAMGQ